MQFYLKNSFHQKIIRNIIDVFEIFIFNILAVIKLNKCDKRALSINKFNYLTKCVKHVYHLDQHNLKNSNWIFIL